MKSWQSSLYNRRNKPGFIFDINPADEDSIVFFPSVHQSIYGSFAPSQFRPLKAKQVHPKSFSA